MKSRFSGARLAADVCATLVAALALAAPVSVLARGAAAPGATRLRPRFQAGADANDRASASAADDDGRGGSALDAERAAVLDALLEQLDAGAPFSLEEARILRRYAAGGRVSAVQADAVISRALYAAYVSGASLTPEQEKRLGLFRRFMSGFETGILDAKARVLADENAAVVRRRADAPRNDAPERAEVLDAGRLPVRSTPIPDVSGAASGDAPLATAPGEPISRVTWYAFTPRESGRYRVSTSRADGNATTLEDTVLAIYAADESGPVAVLPTTATTDGFDDDSAVDGDLQSIVRTTLEAGTRYLIAAGKRGASAPADGLTAVQVSIDREPARTALASDTCAGATALQLNTPVDDTTVGATNDYQLAPGSPCFTANGAVGSFADVLVGPDVVYTFTAPATGTYSFRVKITDITNGYDVAIYTASACPTGTGVQTVSCLAAADRQGGGSSEEIKCQPMTAGQEVFVFVDSFLSAPDPGIGNPSGPFELEVIDCPTEPASNNTPATAGPLACGQEGSVVPLGDIDFFQLGTPAAGSRVFAIVEGGATNGGNGVSDFDLRVTTATTTLEYDDLNNDFPFGTAAPNVAGTPLTGVASYLRVTNFSTSSPSGGLEPYRIVSVVQPPIASATVETEPNDSTATANSAASNYFSGTISGATDSVDVYAFQAAAGDLVYLGLDGDPLRNNTPINGALALLDSTGAVLVSVNDTGSTSSTTPGSSLTSTTPSSPGEGLLYRVRTTGIYYARVTGSTTSVSGDYLLSISKNCQTGGGGVAPASTISVDDVALNEGNAGTTSFTFTVSLSAASASTVTVNYATADDTATSPSDYMSTSGTLTFSPGVTTQSVTVLVNGDTALEPNETFFVNLTSPTNATIADAQGVGTIVNDDAASADLAVAIADAPDPVVAGSNLTYTITATDNGPGAAASAAVTMTLPAGTTFVSATAPSGWTATTPAVGASGTVIFSNPSFAVGSAAFTVVVKVACSVTGVLSATATASASTADPTSADNSATATTTVTNVAPTVACPANVTTPAPAGSCGAGVTFATPTASDDAGCTASVVCLPASGTTFAVGTTTVTCTATDAANQTGSCTFTVTVTDTQAPTLTCPVNVTVGNTAGQCSAVVSYATPTATDNCAGATVVCVPASGSTFAKGTTTVTCTATDASNNTASCSFTVTVNDTQAPTIACPANVSIPANTTQAGTPGAVVTYAAPTVADNCPGVGAPVCLPASGSFFPTGTTTVTCTVSDASANTASCSFTVAVGGGFTNCFVDDASGDVLSINTDPNSPLYRMWQYRVAATGQIITGSAETLSYIPNRSLVASDRDNPTARLELTVNYSSKTATATVTSYGAGGRTYTLRDRNTANDPPCR